MVGAEGFEPPALWSQTRCATRLRYAPTERLSHGRPGNGREVLGALIRAQRNRGIHAGRTHARDGARGEHSGQQHERDLGHRRAIER